MNRKTQILLILFLLLPTLLLLTSPVTLAQSPTVTPFYTPAFQTTLLPPVVSTQGSQFGISVGVSNTSWVTVVVGAPSANNGIGAAYVFENTNSISWDQRAALTPPSGHNGDNFGWSVGIDKQIIVVGAPAANSLTGAAYIYTYDNGIWSYQTTLTAPDAAQGSQFGYAVAVSGNSIIVGAPYDDQPGLIDIGSAYVFTGSGANWTLQQQLGSYYTPPYITPGGYFGAAVDIYGDQVIVGAPNSPDGSTNSYAYPYNRINGKWYLPNALPGQLNTQFGNSVAIYHDMIIVGSPYYDGIGGTDSGRIDVYKWKVASHMFEAISDSDYQLFGSGHVAGFAVDIYRDVELVGAPNATTVFSAEPTRRGAAILFQPKRLLVHQWQALETPPSSGANFGYAVADWGGYLVIGAPYENFGGTMGPVGSVYIYTVPGPPWEAASPTPQNYWPSSTFAIPSATPSSTATPSATPTQTLTPTATPTSLPNVAPQKNFFTISKAVLTWSAVTWAAHYELQISRNSNFTDLITGNNPLAADELSYTTPDLTDGTYYWRVRGIREDGALGSWSAIQQFVVSAES